MFETNIFATKNEKMLKQWFLEAILKLKKIFNNRWKTCLNKKICWIINEKQCLKLKMSTTTNERHAWTQNSKNILLGQRNWKKKQKLQLRGSYANMVQF
jgi:hypothetical protein